MTKPARLDIEPPPVVPPPSTVVVDYERKPVLFLPNGTVLVRKAGY